MDTIPEFTDTEIALIREMLTQRYRQAVTIHLADSEIKLKPNSSELTNHPTVYWHARDANFVVLKCGKSCFRTQFFYTPHEQFSTGIDEYNRLDECVAAVLQTQADHERDSPDTHSDSNNNSNNNFIKENL